MLAASLVPAVRKFLWIPPKRGQCDFSANGASIVISKSDKNLTDPSVVAAVDALAALEADLTVESDGRPLARVHPRLPGVDRRRLCNEKTQKGV